MLIPPGKDAAIEHHKEVIEQIKRYPDNYAVAYSDGSEINEKVGAASVMTMPHTAASACHMGGSSTSTIYAAEVYALMEALQLIGREAPGRKKAIVFTDNQAAIRAVANPGNESAQAYIFQAARAIDKLRSKGTKVELHWVPGHKDIPGNEAADLLAKHAAGEINEEIPWEVPTVPHLMLLRTAVKRKLRGVFKRKWSVDWLNAKHGQTLFELRKTPHKKNVDIYTDVPKVTASTIIRARTGAIGLKGYLGSIRLADTKDCECGRGKETVKHLVLNCSLPRMERGRRKMWGQFRQAPTDINETLSDRDTAQHIAYFLMRSGILGHLGRVNRSDRGKVALLQ